MPFSDVVTITPNGKNILSRGFNGEIIIWDIDTGEKMDYLQNCTEEIVDILVSLDGSTIVSAFTNGIVEIWKSENKLST